MHNKSRLLQAIQDEKAKLTQQQIFHIVGPGFVVLMFVVLIGVFAVRVIHMPEVFGGGVMEQIGYGVLGVAVILALTKGYIFDRWLAGWLGLGITYKANVAKIEAVIARLEAEELEKSKPKEDESEKAPEPAEDKWLRSLKSPVATEVSTGLRE